MLNQIAQKEDKEELLKAASGKQMNLSFLEILSGKSLYKRRKSRVDFISQMDAGGGNCQDLAKE